MYREENINVLLVYEKMKCVKYNRIQWKIFFKYFFFIINGKYLNIFWDIVFECLKLGSFIY